MNKRNVLFALLALLVLGFGGVGAYAWYSSSLEAVTPLKAHIEVLQGTAQLQRQQSSDAQTITGTSTEVQLGDLVRSTQGSVVEIVWGDQGVTRLQDEAELRIESLPDFSTDETSAIKIQLSKGRIWNRMIKLLDIDKPMEVKAGDVVATVRGTVFGVDLNENGKPSVIVDESVVAVSGPGLEDVLLADKQLLDQSSSTASIFPAQDDAWLKESQQQDDQFDKRYAEWLQKREEKRVGKTGNTPKWALGLGERMRMAFAGKNKTELASDFARRALARSFINPEVTDEELDLMLKRASKGKKKQVFREMHAMHGFMQRTGLDRGQKLGLRKPSTTGMQKMRTRRLSVADTELERLYRIAIEIDEDIDQLFYIDPKQLDPAINVASLLARIDALEVQSQALTEQERSLLQKKIAAMRKRLERWFELVNIPVDIPVEPIEETIETPTSTTSIPPAPGTTPVIKPPTTTTKPIVQTRIYQRIELVPSPSSIGIKNQSIVKAFGVRADGAVVDITNSTRFALVTGSLGSLNNNVFTAAFAGTAKVSGTFIDPQGARTATASITINDTTVTADPKALQSIAIVPTGSTTINCGGIIPLKVIATYGDGTKQDVSLKAKLASSDTQVATVSDYKVYGYCPVITTSVIISATVTENGVTKSARLPVTVEPDPQSSPTDPKYRYPILY